MKPPFGNETFLWKISVPVGATTTLPTVSSSWRLPVAFGPVTVPRNS